MVGTPMSDKSAELYEERLRRYVTACYNEKPDRITTRIFAIVFPGIGLPVESCTQWTEPSTDEEAFLKSHEYDRLVEDPTAFLFEVWLPRFTDRIQPAGEQVTFEHDMAFVNGVLAYDLFFNTWGAKTHELVEAGVVPALSSVLKAPLDILGDKLRGYVNLETTCSREGETSLPHARP
jgi:hypothetical protein